MVTTRHVVIAQKDIMKSQSILISKVSKTYTHKDSKLTTNSQPSKMNLKNKNKN